MSNYTNFDLKKNIAYALFYEVSNMAELKNKAINKELEVCFIKPQIVMDPFQLNHAIFKALAMESSSRMKTHSVFSEILYNLSPTKSITESFKLTGINEKDTEVIAVVIDDDNASQQLETISKHIIGKEADNSEIFKFVDINKIKKIFKVQPKEIENGNLLDAIITKMSNKDIL